MAQWKSLDELAGPDSGFHPDLCEVLSSILEGQNNTQNSNSVCYQKPIAVFKCLADLKQPNQNALGQASFQQIPNQPGRDQAQRGQGPPAQQWLSGWDPACHVFDACEETKTANKSPKTPLQGHWWL